MKLLVSLSVVPALAVPFAPSAVQPHGRWIARVELALFASICGYFVLALLSVAGQA